MTIILEGPDGTGKTMLARKLCAMRGYTYVHNGPYPNSTGEDLLKFYTEQLLMDGVVIDRSFLSEAVYGGVVRGQDRLGELGATLLTRLCLAREVKQVICLPPYETCATNWRLKNQEKAEYVTDLEKAKKVYNAYHKLASDNWKYLDYDYLNQEGMTRENLVKNEVLMNKLLFWGNDPLPTGVIGSRAAKFLIVGDQVNLNRAWTDLPFYSLGGVSKFLWEAMTKAGVKEEDVAFVNSMNVDGGIANFWQIIRLLPNFKRAIALGGNPDRLLEFDKVPYQKIPHPNYWLRFQYKNLDAYPDLLRKAIA